MLDRCNISKPDWEQIHNRNEEREFHVNRCKLRETNEILNLIIHQ
jgi:hypothetical protein